MLGFTLMRTSLSKTFAAIPVMIVLSGQGNAEPLLKDVLKDYYNAESSVAQRMMIASNVSNIERTLGWANTALRAQRRSRRALYCLPHDIIIESNELVDMLRDAVWDEPRLGETPIAFAVLVTLQKAFPCKAPTDGKR